MPLTYIDTNACPRSRQEGAGEFAEILSNQLCGAKNVVAQLRWLRSGEQFEAVAGDNNHQLIYLMEGEGTIVLNGERRDVAKGAGVYLGLSEAAAIVQRGSAPLKLLHLRVRKTSD